MQTNSNGFSAPKLVISKKKIFTEIRKNFSAKIGNSNDFSAQKQVISKKKGLHRNSEGFFGQNRKFKRFFSPKTGDLQKKKKVFTEIQGQNRKFKRVFIPNRGIYFTTAAPKFLWGGAVFIFQQKLASKSPKTCQFAYFTGRWGGSSPPLPLATLLFSAHNKKFRNTKHMPNRYSSCHNGRQL